MNKTTNESITETLVEGYLVIAIYMVTSVSLSGRFADLNHRTTISPDMPNAKDPIEAANLKAMIEEAVYVVPLSAVKI